MSRRKIGKRRKLVPKKIKKKNRLYPVMWCTGENIAIGLSYKIMKFKADIYGNVRPKYKVSIKHWLPQFCKFRSEEYVVDLRNYEDGDKIRCSKCKKPVDFRLFPSLTRPELVGLINDKEDNTTQLPNS